jgi:small basic protein
LPHEPREDDPHVLLPLLGLLVGVLAGLVLNVNVSFEFSRYSAVAILAALDSVLGAVRAELDGVYDNRIFISGFLVNAITAVILTFIGDRLGLDLYLVALITFGLRIFNNVAIIRRHRRRHQQGVRPHRRGQPRGAAHDHGPWDRARVRAQEGRRH